MQGGDELVGLHCFRHLGVQLSTAMESVNRYPTFQAGSEFWQVKIEGDQTSVALKQLVPEWFPNSLFLACSSPLSLLTSNKNGFCLDLSLSQL